MATEKLKPLLKRIDDICTPILKLGGEKGVRAKDLEKNYTKGPLAELAFELLSCLYDSKKHLDDQNMHIAKANAALKEQDRKINELDTSLEEKEGVQSSILNNILTEVKKNGDKITEIKECIAEKSQKLTAEAEKVSSYAQILQKTAGEQTTKNNLNLRPAAVAKRVIDDFKASNRRKNVVFYNVKSLVDSMSKKILHDATIKEMLYLMDLDWIKPSTFEVLKKSDDLYTLRVHFLHESSVARILKNGWKLKRTLGYVNTYVAPERTPSELKERAELVQKLKSQIKNDPATKWLIRGRKIVRSGTWSPPQKPSESDSEPSDSDSE